MSSASHGGRNRKTRSDARVVKADIAASNGVIHLIDRVKAHAPAKRRSSNPAASRPPLLVYSLADSRADVSGHDASSCCCCNALEPRMTVYKLDRELWVSRPLPDVFEFFSRADNLQRITPPWMMFRILTPGPIEMREGAMIAYALRVRGMPLRWLTRIERWNPPFEFVDIQAKGPYKLWRHTHRFSEVDGGTLIADTVEYALPFGMLGRLAHWMQVAQDLSRIFDYREQRVRELFA